MLKRYLVQGVLVVFIGLLGTAQVALGQTQTTPARAAIVIDLTSGRMMAGRCCLIVTLWTNGSNFSSASSSHRS